MKSLVLASTMIVASSASAIAMPQCGDRDHVIGSLSETYSEQHIASGFQSTAGLMEIWASDSDGTWTILLTRPDGQTCVVASGTHWLENNMVPVIGEPA